MTAQSEVEWPELIFTPIASGLASPLGIANAGDGSGRLFVIEQAGKIRIVQDGVLLATPFLDIQSKTSCCSERGLLGLAFPPGYASKGYFYVNYTDNAGDTVVARYQVTADANIADPDSEAIILTVDQPFANHNGGHLSFGPADGLLYIGMGDGGSSNDPQGNGQNLATLLGKLLRIDVESGVEPYGIPPTNPFVGTPGARGEIWALGLRNPWRFTFDRATNDLFIGDVGQNAWEEIDFQPATSNGGENYGWRCYEGNHPANLTGCPPIASFTFPIAEYSHSSGCSVTGGHIYRGLMYPRMQGVYLYGDYCSGRVWGLQQVDGTWQNQLLTDTSYSIATFGEDEAGTLYLSNISNGTVYEISDSVVAVPMRSAAIVLQDRPVGNGYVVTGQVAVRDEANAPVAGAKVEVEWRLPGGAVRLQSATTNDQGIALFRAAGGAGIYRLTVMDAFRSGYIFDPEGSVLTRAHRAVR